MNQTAADTEAETEKPENYKYYDYCPNHGVVD